MLFVIFSVNVFSIGGLAYNFNASAIFEIASSKWETSSKLTLTMLLLGKFLTLPTLKLTALVMMASIPIPTGPVTAKN
jgi:hypothetical protein